MKKKLFISTVLLAQLAGSIQINPAFASNGAEYEQRYWAGYRVGVADALNHQVHQWTDTFIDAGYQRGLREGRLEQANGGQGETPPNLIAENDVAMSMQTLPPLSVSQKQFIERLAPRAQELGSQYDLFPSVLLAQAALESNWGRSGLAMFHHNLFGVKALPGQSAVLLPTSEDTATGMIGTTAAFCHYPDEEHALTAYVELLQAPTYAGVHRKQAQSYQAATRALTGVFATDRHYHQKLNQIIEAYHLTRFDNVDHQSGGIKEKRHIKLPVHERSQQQTASPKPQREVKKEGLAWYWWPVSIISGGSLTWLVDFLRHRNR